MKKLQFFLVLACLTISAIAFVSLKEIKADAGSVIDQEMKDSVTATNTERWPSGVPRVKKCEGKLRVNLKPISLLVDRQEHGIVNFPNGETLSIETGKPQGCEKKEVDNASSVRWKNLDLFLATNAFLIEIKGKREARALELLETEKSITLDKDVKKIENGSIDYFVFPKMLIPTMDNRPVIFECAQRNETNTSPPSVASCDVIYLHPAGVFLKYSFLLKKFPESEYLQVDKEIRNRLQKMIDTAQK